MGKPGKDKSFPRGLHSTNLTIFFIGAMSLLVCVCILVYVVFAADENSGQELNLIMFDESNSDKYTVCNDGTRGGYYFGKALDPQQTDIWVIHLPGGGQCYDEQSCNSRSKGLMSSKNFDSKIYVQGFLDKSPAKTPLWGANKAYLAYCSSDGYMGDVGASDDTWGYHFRGQRLVAALFQAIKDDHNFNNASIVYLTGTSAGARGMMTLVDQLVSTVLPPTATAVALLDSPYYLDIQPYSAQSKGFQYQEQQKYALFNTTGILSDECVAAYPSPSEQWKCQFGQYRMPFVKTPYFVIASQYDSYQLEELTQRDPDDYSADTVRYTESFAQLDREGIRNLSLADLAEENVKFHKDTKEEYLPSQHGLRRRFGSQQQVPSPHPQSPTSNSYHLRVREKEEHISQPSPAQSAIRASEATVVSSDVVGASGGAGVGVGVGYGFYTWACYNHAVANSDLFYTAATTEGVSQKQAFEAYLARKPAVPAATKVQAKVQAKEEAVLEEGVPQEVARARTAASDVADPRWEMSWTDNCLTFNCGQHCKG